MDRGRDAVRMSLGALALGMLDADERRAVLQHADECLGCSAELDDFLEFGGTATASGGARPRSGAGPRAGADGLRGHLILVWGGLPGSALADSLINLWVAGVRIAVTCPMLDGR
jgi:hypothetical protein